MRTTNQNSFQHSLNKMKTPLSFSRRGMGRRIFDAILNYSVRLYIFGNVRTPSLMHNYLQNATTYCNMYWTHV